MWAPLLALRSDLQKTDLVHLEELLQAMAPVEQQASVPQAQKLQVLLQALEP